MNKDEIKEGDFLRLPGGEYGHAYIVHPAYVKVRMWGTLAKRFKTFKIEDVKHEGVSFQRVIGQGVEYDVE